MGSASFVITVNGSGFNYGSRVMWNTTSLESWWGDNSTTVYATVPASLLEQAGTASISVVTDGVASNTAHFLVSPLFLSAISPSTLNAGGPDAALTITGGGFAANTKVLWDSTPLVVTAVSDNRMSATVPAALTTVWGNVPVTVANPDGASVSDIVQVTPVITSVTPASPPPGNSDLLITVTGAGFKPDGRLWFSSPSVSMASQILAITFVNSTRLTAVVPASLAAGFSKQGCLWFETSRPFPYPGTGIAYVNGISPNSAVRGSPGFILRLFGGYFPPGAAVRWNDTPLKTTVADLWELDAEVPASLIANAGTAPIRVAGPDGFATPPSSFQINAPAPTVGYLWPASVPAGNLPFTLSVHGSNFQPGASVRFLYKLLSATFVDSTEVTVRMPASLASSGEVSVLNPDGFESPAVWRLTVVAPIVFAADPAIAFQGTDLPVTLRGRDFTPLSQVTWQGTPVPTTFLSPTRLQAVVPGSLITGYSGFLSALTAQVASGNANVFVREKQPYIRSADPPEANAGGPDLDLTLSGSGFVDGSTVTLSGSFHVTTILPVVWKSVNELHVVLPEALLVNSDALSLSVNNPDGTTSAFAYKIHPVMKSSNPSYIPPSPQGGPFSITGKGFNQGEGLRLSLCFVRPIPACDSLVAYAVSSTLISGVLTAQVAASVPQVWFELTDWSGTVSKLPFHIGAPGMDSLEPASITAGAGDFTLTVNGAAFPQGSRVQWNGTDLATRFVSESRLTAMVPSSLAQSVDLVPVTIGMPDGSVTPPLEFPVNPTAPPAISPDGVVNAFSYGAVSPGAMISIFGSGLAGGTYPASVTPLPTTLHGVSVSVDGRPAPLFFVSPNQINAQVSTNTGGGRPDPVVVKVAGLTSAPQLMDCYSQAPGILFNPATNHVIAQNYPDWTMNSPSNPAHPGQQVIVYWTGSSLDLPAAGQVTPTGGPQNQPGYPHTATFGGAPAKVTFVGPTPGFVGLLQFNVEVPDLKPGEYVLDFSEGNSSTQLPGNERLISVGPK